MTNTFIRRGLLNEKAWYFWNFSSQQYAALSRMRLEFIQFKYEFIVQQAEVRKGFKHEKEEQQQEELWHDGKQQEKSQKVG